MNNKHNIALIFGGKGLEHSVSVKGAEYLYGKIDQQMYNVISVYVKRDGEWTISNKHASPTELAEEKIPMLSVSPSFAGGKRGLITASGEFISISAAFPLLHGNFGEDGTVQGALECAAIPYVGCDALSSAICYDKAMAKTVAEALSIPTARWMLLTSPDPKAAREDAEKRFAYPLFIKPSGLGSSFGAAVINGREDFEKSYQKAHRLGGGRVLIEERVDIYAELECGYFGSECKELFTDAGEIRYENGFYDYDAKYNSGSATVSPYASVDSKIKAKIKEFSLLLRERIGIRGIARFDYFLAKDGRLLFNEINTMPGFTASSLYPMMLEASGLEVKEAVSRLITDCIAKR